MDLKSSLPRAEPSECTLEKLHFLRRDLEVDWSLWVCEAVSDLLSFPKGLPARVGVSTAELRLVSLREHARGEPHVVEEWQEGWADLRDTIRT